MRKFYKEFFCIPKEGKIGEKVILVRMALTVMVMVVCLAAMGMSAYAYFSHSITSASNTIKSADFDVSVTITVTDTKTSEPIPANEDGTYSLGKGTYDVKLTRGGTAETGFCIVKTVFEGVETEYHTQQFVRDINEMTFKIDLSGVTDTGTVTVSFTPHWGTSSFYGYSDNSGLYIQPNATIGVIKSPTKGEEGSSDDGEGTGETNTGTNTETNTGTDTGTDTETNTGTDTETNTGTDTGTESKDPEDTVYIVKEGDALSLIAQDLKVDEGLLAAFNNITDPNYIQVGQEIKIPPEDWKIPEDTSVVSDITTEVNE